MIYLASPYSHSDPDVRALRYVAAVKAASQLARAGVPVYSPIAHSHPIDHEIEIEVGRRPPHMYWMHCDLLVLAVCTRVLVLQIPGWDESRGVRHEVDAARRAGIPVVYAEPARVLVAAEDPVIEV